MKSFTHLSTFLIVFFGQDSDEYGANDAEVVNTAYAMYGESGGGYLDKLIENIDDFIESYPDNEQAAIALNALTQHSAGDMRYYPPTLTDFLKWLSATLRAKRDSGHHIR